MFERGSNFGTDFLDCPKSRPLFCPQSLALSDQTVYNKDGDRRPCLYRGELAAFGFFVGVCALPARREHPRLLLQVAGRAVRARGHERLAHRLRGALGTHRQGERRGRAFYAVRRLSVRRASALAFAVFLLTCSPCVSAVAAAARETGVRRALLYAAGQTLSALLLCYLTYAFAAGGAVYVAVAALPAVALFAMRSHHEKIHRNRGHAPFCIHR